MRHSSSPSRRQFLETALTAAAGALVLPAYSSAAEDAGTSVLKWQDGKKAVYMIGFDDSAPSQLKFVVPEIEKRKIVANFYLVPGGKVHEANKAKWEKAAESPYFEEANHTFTHKGASTPEQLDEELAKCNEVLYAGFHPQRKKPRLLAFGKPGGVPWTIGKEDFEAAMSKHHLVNRFNFSGPPINYKSAAECLAAIDKTLAKGEAGQMIFHGVGGDWLTTPLDWFMPILDKLEASRSDLWVTDFVSYHKYLTERSSAEVKTVQNTAAGIKLELSSKADVAWYDLPLTLSTKVPAAWKGCSVSQGAVKAKAPVVNGAVQYAATPGAGTITLTPEA